MARKCKCAQGTETRTHPAFLGSGRVLALEFSRTSERPFEFPFRGVLPGLRKGRGVEW